MRKVLSLLLTLALIVTSLAALPPSESYAADPTPTVKKYHLDMGIWVADKSHQGNKYEYIANIPFGREVEITAVMSIEEAQDKGVDVLIERGGFYCGKLRAAAFVNIGIYVAEDFVFIDTQKRRLENEK